MPECICDYSLLRPLDLEAVVNGTQVCDSRGRTLTLDGATELLAQSGVESLRLAPLFWLGGKPVYEDSTLYATGTGLVDGRTAHFIHVLSISTLSWPVKKRTHKIDVHMDGKLASSTTVEIPEGKTLLSINCIWG